MVERGTDHLPPPYETLARPHWPAQAGGGVTLGGRGPSWPAQARGPMTFFERGGGTAKGKIQNFFSLKTLKNLFFCKDFY